MVRGRQFLRLFLSLVPFGIQVMVPSIIEDENLLFNRHSWKYLKIHNKSSSKKILKNSLLNPSGPGALFNFPDFITASNSMTVYGSSRISLVCSVSLGILCE